MTLALSTETEGLARMARRDLQRVFALVEPGESASEALNDLLPGLVREYGAMGAAVAADWYDEQRELAEARGLFQAIPTPASDRGARALIGWSLLEATSDQTLLTLLAGGVQRRIADHVRSTVAQSSIQDPMSRGWVRVGRGECDWCRQYLDGEVHYVEGYDFPAHDHCRCSVRPEWG